VNKQSVDLTDKHKQWLQ